MVNVDVLVKYVAEIRAVEAAYRKRRAFVEFLVMVGVVERREHAAVAQAYVFVGRGPCFRPHAESAVAVVPKLYVLEQQVPVGQAIGRPCVLQTFYCHGVVVGADEHVAERAVLRVYHVEPVGAGVARAYNLNAVELHAGALRNAHLPALRPVAVEREPFHLHARAFGHGEYHCRVVLVVINHAPAAEPCALARAPGVYAPVNHRAGRYVHVPAVGHCERSVAD